MAISIGDVLTLFRLSIFSFFSRKGISSSSPSAFYGFIKLKLILKYLQMSLPTYLERGLRAEKDTIDQLLAELVEKNADREEMEASTRKQVRSELLISKYADLCVG